MIPIDFCYWLQGHFELNDSNDLTPEQVQTIRNHLNLVFEHHIDKMYSGDPQHLQDVHDGNTEPGGLHPPGAVKPTPPKPTPPPSKLIPEHSATGKPMPPENMPYPSPWDRPPGSDLIRC